MAEVDQMHAANAYLLEEARFHSSRHFEPEAGALLDGLKIRWTAGDPRESGPADLVIPAGAPIVDPAPWSVPFAGTRLTLWNRLALPSGWTPWPTAETPLWYFAPGGTAMPAWDLRGNLLRLLFLAEETERADRDRHGRFAAAMSERAAPGLIEVPAFNEAVAALIALAGARAAAHPPRAPHDEPARLAGLHLPVRPAGLVLSHDLDILRGNDPITQAIRSYRWLRPLASGRPPRDRGAHALWTNAVHPYRHYRDAVGRIVDIEREAGARSTFYFLNGRGGRCGARSGDADIPGTRALIPEGWNVGIHYNYDTLLDEARFRAQWNDLQRLLGEPITGGRGHYLRFDPARSFAFLDRLGLRYDETLGYPDRAGFRAGVAGAYHPPDPRTGRAFDLVEIPLALMDVALERQYPGDTSGAILRLFRHVNAIGGSLAMVVHLEAIGHPELDEDRFRYADLLLAFKREGARFMLPGDYL